MIDLCQQSDALLWVLIARDGLALQEAGLTVAECEALEVGRAN